MGQSRGGATTHAIASDSGAVFEVERFDWADDGRIELEGAWSNLRGTRFVRPALELDARGTRHRLLAVLDHKPWAPGDGGRWQAAFAWDGDVDDVEAAQLTVAPGIAIELPLPGGPGRSTKAGAPMKRRPRKATTAKPRERVADSAPSSDAAAPAEAPDVAARRRELDAALERAAAAEQRIAALERERDAAVAQRRAAAAELE